ncbi:hypothetical protein C8R45DRAFT_1113685 [Mycena sanguinolenta]|nr:hypothetical protein C8R45DRAFT_1113685 [Mycena sanguinolenta]
MPLRPKKDSAARARAAKAPRKVPFALSSESDSSESDNCHWDGTESDKIPQFFEPFTEPGAVNSGSATEWACEDGPLPTDDESSDPDRDLEGADLLRSFVLSGENDNTSISTVYTIITEHKSEINWSAAESKLKGPYTGNSDRTQRRNDQKLREKEERDKLLRARLLPPPQVVAPSQPPPALSTLSPAVQISNATLPPPFPDNKIFTGHLSDISSGDLSDAAAPEMSVAGAVPSPISTAIDTPAMSSDTLIPHQVRPPPALKYRKFAVPQEERRRAAAILAIAARTNILASSLTAINKLIASKKDVFHAGNASLQSYGARSIQSHLHMVVKNQKGWKLASETAAEAQRFATKWGGHMLKNKIIPAFEAAHGPGDQMLLMVDHSQGHCMYRLDALLVSCMNLNPGGKLAYMRDGWGIDENVQRVQKMVYPADHSEHPGQPKGMQAVLQERGLWPAGKFVKECKKGRSMVAETIEDAGHLFFWGAVKKYLCDYRDYTFAGLKANMGALASVQRKVIRKWEHRMIQWMDAYRSDLGPKEAQRLVRAFSSTTYSSHQGVSETLGQQFDQ